MLVVLSSARNSSVLAGNKCDLKEEREVTYLEASRFALENGVSTAVAHCS